MIGIEAASNLVPAGLLTALIGLCGMFVRFMLQDRGAGFALADERREDVVHLAERIALLEHEVSDQRSLKHAETNERMRAELLLDTVRRLSKNCTCHALEPVQELLDRRTTPD